MCAHSPLIPHMSKLLLLVLVTAALCPNVLCYLEELADAEQMEQEVQQLRQKLRTAPDFHTHLAMAVTLQHLNHMKPDGAQRIPEAVEQYRAALALLDVVHKPQDRQMNIRVRANLAAMLLEGGEIPACLHELDLAEAQAAELGIPPSQLTDLAFNRGKALGAGGQLQAAEAAYLHTTRISYGVSLPAFAKAAAAMANMPDELLSQVEEVLLLASQQESGHSLLESVADDSEDPDDDHRTPSSSMGKAHSKAPPSRWQNSNWLAWPAQHDLVYLGFALFNALDKRGRYADAWRHLVAANTRMRAVVPYSLSAEQLQARLIREAFKKPMMGAGHYDRTPIFVVGMPRSGSTLMEQMFAGHSDVWGAGEDTRLAPMTTQLNEDLARPGADVLEIMRQYGKRYVDEMRAMVPPPPAEPAALQNAGRAGSTNLPAAKVSARSPYWPSRIVDKMLRNLWLVGYVQMLLPLSCVVHVMRHPLDVGLSCYSQPFGYNGVPWSWDLQEIAAQINMTYDMSRHWDEAVPGKVHTIFYEEMVAHFPVVAAELLEHCGLSWQDSVLSFHKVDRPVASASVAQVRKPLYTSSIQRWKRYEEQLQPLRDALGGSVQWYEERLQQALARREAAALQKAADEAAAAAMLVDAGSVVHKEL